MASQDQPNRPAKPRAGRRRPPIGTRLLGLDLDRGPLAEPLYKQIRQAVHASIMAGDLGSGARLPPERELARALGIDRATASRAYQELVADGVVEARGSRGTVVLGPREEMALEGREPRWLAGLPDLEALGPDPTLLMDIASRAGRTDLISFAAGAPGPDLQPVGELRRALDDAIGAWGPAPFGYGPVEGFAPLRRAIRERLCPDLFAPGDGTMIVSGAIQALALAARAMVQPGDEVVVEAPTFPGIVQAFGLAGARLTGVPVDASGMRTDLLEAVLAARRVRLIVAQPTFHNPTGVTLSAERREHLLSLASRHRVPVLEDDPYGAVALEGAPPGPLKRMDRQGSVIYVSSFSKTVSPALRLGWVIAPSAALGRLALAKQLADLNSSALSQMILTRYIENGDHERHVARLRPEYRRRRDALVAALAPLRGRLSLDPVPAGGFHLWARMEAGPYARLLSAYAPRCGVAVVAGEAFYPPHSLRGANGANRLRLSFPEVSPDRYEEGARRLARALDQLPPHFAGDSPPTTPVLV